MSKEDEVAAKLAGRQNVMLHNDVTSCSEYDPNEPVTSTTAIPLRANRYQRDVIEQASKALGMSQQEFIRLGMMELARKNGFV